MNKQQFDNIIRENLEAHCGKNDFGYEITKNGPTYSNYYRNDVFEKFKKEMQQPQYLHFFKSYCDGSGSELKERKGRYGIMPPKMASVASSSRFCYLALRKLNESLGGIEVEKGCPIPGISGTAPQLDAYIPKKNTYLEVKCHEIFDAHSITLKSAYWDKLYGKGNDFGFVESSPTNSDHFSISPSVFGVQQNATMFDIKQLLCHLLGIAANSSTPSELVYLFFMPESTQYRSELRSLFAELSSEVSAIFNSTPIRTFCKKNNIRLRAIVEYAKCMDTLTSQNTHSLIDWN